MEILGKVKQFIYGGRGFWDVYRRNLRFIPLLVTNRCNSQCKTCFIWAKKPKHDIPVEIVEKILSDKVIKKKAYFFLTGGEFLLHPEYREILSLFAKQGRKYVLLSNGILVDKLIETVEEFGIQDVYLSLDGRKETYKKVRGVDAYDNVVKAIRKLKNITRVRVGYVISPWNFPEDLVYVERFCKIEGVSFDEPGVYHNLDYFDTKIKSSEAYQDDFLPKGAKFTKLHNPWIHGDVVLPCLNIRVGCSIMPDCDVYMCQQKDIVLGNLKQETLSKIWQSKKTLEIQRSYSSCNECWLGCQRSFDVNLLHNLTALFPNKILKKYFQRYSWDEVDRVYGEKHNTL